MITVDNLDAATGVRTVETWDVATGYTRTVNGVVEEQRALTADETTIVTAHDTAATRDTNRQAIEQAIDAAIVELDQLIAAPALTVIPSGTRTTAQLSGDIRTLRNEAQATRAGAQTVALRLKQLTKLVRGDYDTVT